MSMSAVDAATWELEMGRDPQAHKKVGKNTRAGTGYARFEPAFEERPWLRKAKLVVVDRQKVKGQEVPCWIVLQDGLQEGVFLMIRYRKLPFMQAEVTVHLVRPAKAHHTPDSITGTGNWNVQGAANSPRGFLRALNIDWGGGRHVNPDGALDHPSAGQSA